MQTHLFIDRPKRATQRLFDKLEMRHMPQSVYNGDGINQLVSRNLHPGA